MSSIDNIKIGNTKYDLKDTASGYGVFSAEQVMQSTVPGATLVGTLKYRTFSTTNKTFGTTNTVNLYSTGGTIRGNNYSASVLGNVLNISSSGQTAAMIMPNVQQYSGGSVYDDVISSLESAGIITLQDQGSGELVRDKILTANCNINVTFYDIRGTAQSFSLAAGETTVYTPDLATASDPFSQNPDPGTELTSTSTVTIQQLSDS